MLEWRKIFEAEITQAALSSNGLAGQADQGRLRNGGVLTMQPTLLHFIGKI